MNNSASSITRNLLLAFVVLAVVFLGYTMLTAKDNRSTTDRVGDAVHDLPQGLDKASQQLQDRTPAQKLGDSIGDAAHDAKRDASGD